jgi:hypothetical protein
MYLDHGPVFVEFEDGSVLQCLLENPRGPDYKHFFRAVRAALPPPQHGLVLVCRLPQDQQRAPPGTEFDLFRDDDDLMWVVCSHCNSCIGPQYEHGFNYSYCSPLMFECPACNAQMLFGVDEDSDLCPCGCCGHGRDMDSSNGRVILMDSTSVFLPAKRVERVVPDESPKKLDTPCSLCHPSYPYPQEFVLLTVESDDTIPTIFRSKANSDEGYYRCAHTVMSPVDAFVEVTGDLACDLLPPFACMAEADSTITWSAANPSMTTVTAPSTCTGVFGHLPNWRSAVLPRGSRFLVPVDNGQMFMLSGEYGKPKLPFVCCRHLDHGSPGSGSDLGSGWSSACSKTAFATRMSLPCDSYIVNVPKEPYVFGTDLNHDGVQVHVRFTDGTYGSYWGD